MSEQAQATNYGVKLATTDALAELANEGHTLAKDELRARLPHELHRLLGLYLAAYGQDRSIALRTLLSDIEQL
ncbi:hypothetical protein H0A71_16695 [Alcaligenaceae bacterium]|nr:hypothetical protein [Alcaligenaceae bacterium]